MPIELVTPSLDRLPAFVDALRRGWSPDNTRQEAAIRHHLQRIEQDPARFVADQDDPEGRSGEITLLDGMRVPRLPGFHLWMWDGDFCGVVNARWRPGTTDLPPHCLGHVGYSVVPWKRGMGYATDALRLVMPRLKAIGLPFVDLTTNADNLPSQRVILANGGRLIGAFEKPESSGGGEALLFRLDL
jgi:predicted acetyltransferase